MALKVYDRLKRAIRFWLLRRLPACQQTVTVLSQSMERPLTLREHASVKLHLWVCTWCQWYLEHLHLIRGAARAKAADSADLASASGLSHEARERIKRKLAGGN